MCASQPLPTHRLDTGNLGASSSKCFQANISIGRSQGKSFKRPRIEVQGACEPQLTPPPNAVAGRFRSVTQSHVQCGPRAHGDVDHSGNRTEVESTATAQAIMLAAV